MTEHEDRRTSRRAAGYDPEADAHAERLAALGDQLSPTARMALGYQTSAREAARTTNEEK